MSNFKIVKLIDPIQLNLAGGLNFQGDYDNATAYVVGDVVTYNGSSYAALQNTTGNLPTDTNNWQLLAEKGDPLTVNAGENIDIDVISPTEITINTVEDDDAALTANSATVIPSQKAVKAYADTKLAKATNVTSVNDTGIADGEIVVFNLTNKDIRTSDKTIVTTIGSDDTTVPTSKAVKDATVASNIAITGATKTKITYDAKGLVTAGADAGTSDITGLDTALGGKVAKDGDTMAGNLNMGTNNLIGGTGVTSVLKLQGTTANGTATSAAIQALVGNNGATTAVTILNNGNVGIGTTSPGAKLQIDTGAAATIGQIIKGAASQTADLSQWQSSGGTTIAQVLASGQMRYLYGGPLGTALQNVATETYVQSRSQNLLTNGFGYLRDNTNFTQFVFDAANHATGFGGFSYDGIDASRFIDESFAIDTGEVYNFSYYIKLLSKSVPAEVPRFYSGIYAVDADGLNISANQVYKTPGSAFTSLAADLNNGDTTITLNNATGWNNSAVASQKRIGFYPYTNSQGFTYPDYTYTRDVTAGGLWNAGGISGNVITLAAPWSGGFKPAGTKVANHIDSNTYEYMVANANTPTKHTKYNDYVGKVEGDWSVSSFTEGSLAPSGGHQTSPNSKLRWGTARIQLLYLLSYNTPVGTAKTIVSGLSFGLAENASFDYKIGNISNSTANAVLNVTNTATDKITQVIKGIASQTADLLQIQNSSGTSLLSINSSGNLDLKDVNIISGTTTGTKIGTGTSQKLSFWNATPIVQPTTSIAESAFVENSGGVNVNDDSTFDGYTIRQVVKALRDAGLLA